MFVNYWLKIVIALKSLRNATTILEITINSSRFVNYLCLISYAFLILCVLFTLICISCLQTIRFVYFCKTRLILIVSIVLLYCCLLFLIILLLLLLISRRNRIAKTKIRFFLKQVIVVLKVEIDKIIIVIDFRNISCSINCRYISSYLISDLYINLLSCRYIN